ncbi:UNVERIFIED_ORG: hypothetical protein B2H93_04845 [Clostridium botulinum]
MKIYNICGDIKRNLDKAYDVIRKSMKQDDGNIYNNTPCLMAINNNPVVAYINTQSIIHLIFLKEKEEYLFKYGNKRNGYKKELKFKDIISVNKKVLWMNVLTYRP